MLTHEIIFLSDRGDGVKHSVAEKIGGSSRRVSCNPLGWTTLPFFEGKKK